MKKGIFYTETILKLSEDINKNPVKAISDDLKEVELLLLDETGKPADINEILKYLELKSIDNISDNSIQKEIKKIKNNKEKMKELTEKLAKEVSDPLELLSKIEEVILNEVKKLLQERTYFKKNKIVRIAGITKEKNGKLIFESKSILWKEKLKKASQQGIKVFSNSPYQLPIVLKKTFEKIGNNFVPTKNNFKVIVSPLANPEHLKFLFEHLYRTLQAKKENKINAIPTIYISIKKDAKLEKNVVDIINNINKEFKNILDTQKLDNIDRIYEYLNLLLDNIFKDRNIITQIEIKLPLPNQEINIEQMKIKLKNPLLDVGVKIKEKEVGKERLEEIVNEVLDKIFNDYVEINTTYRIDDTGFGFFENNLDIYNETPKAVLVSTFYDKIIDEIFEKVNKLKQSS